MDSVWESFFINYSESEKVFQHILSCGLIKQIKQNFEKYCIRM